METSRALAPLGAAAPQPARRLQAPLPPPAQALPATLPLPTSSLPAPLLPRLAIPRVPAPLAPPGRRAPLPTRPAPRPRPRIVPRPQPQPRSAPVFASSERPTGPVVPLAPPGAWSGEVCVCPCCGRLVPISNFDAAPYGAELYLRSVGGPVQPGRIHMRAGGRIDDRTANTRGSIVIAPMWDPSLADALEARLAEIAGGVGEAARQGALVRMGAPRE